ncbi:unnamed protein product [Bursaphelenchus xylophilus]|uniref:(pine wood nematode) hypothetical protein n=1 Tax=Bursaphelenchus xylophilus TaxID=6326 RepID=A0A1I7RRL0_BURXY|nr:unnamed protein product [Bursaphelenchus xylophilus]CAG9131093.1 unnamed protein product [Bursaphelenchus xylophilus]
MRKVDGRSLEVKGSGYVPPPNPGQRRGPFVMPSQKRNVSATKIAMVPSSTTQQESRSTRVHSKFGSTQSITASTTQVCNCQHPADLNFLQDIYVENLRIKNEMLELQNKYLQNLGNDGEPGTTAASATIRGHREERDSGIGGVSGSSTTYQQRSRRVNFTDKAFKEEDLYNQLEEAYKTEGRLQEKVKALQHENRKVTAQRDEAIERLAGFEGGSKSFTKERKTLMEDNIELQRRLDDLTPLLAEKDAEISRLESEKMALTKRIRQMTASTASRQTSTEKRDYNGSGEFRETKKWRERVNELEIELNEERKKIIEKSDELTALRQRFKELQVTLKSEKSMKESVNEENIKLIKDNSNLTSRISRLEQLVDQQKRELNARPHVDITSEDLRQLRDDFKRVQGELAGAKERIRIEEGVRTKLENELKEREQTEDEEQEKRVQIQEELAALKVMSNALSAENQGLREEKISLTERIEVLYEKIDQSSQEIEWLAKKLEQFRTQYFDTLARLQAELKRQSEAGSELEDIVRRAQELVVAFPKTKSTKITIHQQKSSTQVIHQPPAPIPRSSSRVVGSPEGPDSGRPPLSPVRVSPSPRPTNIDSGPRIQRTSSVMTSSSRSNRSLVTLRSQSQTQDSESTASLLAQKYRRKMS